MQLSINDELLKTLVICTTTLGFKMIVTNMWRLFPSIFAGSAPPEDSWLWKMIGLFNGDQTHGVSSASSSKDNDDKHDKALARSNRVIANDLENIPISLVLAWIAAITLGNADDDSKQNDGLATWAIIFTAARVAHSFTYLLGITGVRSVAFGVGLASTIRFGVYALANVNSF